jgi:adenosylhomocysteine nucleosidase
MSSDFPGELIVMALPLEAQGVFEAAGVAVLFTGVGKVNAAHALTRQLMEYRHANRTLPRVVNFGTAGSQRLPTGSLVECVGFAQRDMDVSGLGFPVGVTPFEDVPAVLEFSPRFPHLQPGTCGSGDSFVMTALATQFDVLDMEAYALAKVCWREGVPFTAVKFVTDGADPAAGGDWQSNLHRAADLFYDCYRRLGG